MLKSLRGRLFVGLTAIIVLTGAVGGTFAYMWAYSEAIEMQDFDPDPDRSVRAERLDQSEPARERS